MKVQPVNINSTYKYNSVNRSKVCKTGFRGLFSKNEPDLSRRFHYGLEALDGQTILVVTSDENSSNMMLELFADRIDIPVMKKYTLLVKEGELKDREALDSNFAVFKRDNNYYLLSLSDHLLRKMLVDFPGDGYNKDNIIKGGEIKRLTDGHVLHTGELVWRTSGESEKFVFAAPKGFNTLNADKYLDVKTINNIEDLNKRTLKLLNSEQVQQSESKGITFKDIGGLDDAIETLKKYVVRPINCPQIYENIRLNKGVLLYGPPRCGKTLLGKALANEVNASYAEYNANEFKSSSVGESERNIREVFNQAISNAPSITFIDEFDSIAKTRDGSSNARFDDPMVNQFLGCMSNLEKCAVPAFIIAATNMKKLIDPALLATGRFGLHIEVPLPNLEGLKQIFKIHTRKQKLAEDVNINEIAKTMFEHKFSGSDAAEVVTDAFFNVLERTGLNAKIDNKTVNYSDMKNLSLSKTDFIKAIQRLISQKRF